MAKPASENCGNCAAFIREDKNGGTCHKHAPHCQMEGMMQDSEAYGTCWPWVAKSDWCAQWQQGVILNEEED